MNITFIIPSKGRPTLANTMNSLFALGNFNMAARAVIAFDAVEPIVSDSRRVKVVVTPEKLGKGVNSAGDVRNFAFNSIKKEYTYLDDKNDFYNFPHNDWIGFIDDDDTIDHKYTEVVFDTVMRGGREDKLPDVIIFRMQYQDKTILPPVDFKYDKTDNNAFKLENKVGISFCCTAKLFHQLGGFIPSSGEDSDFLKRAEVFGANIVLVDHIGYYVCPLGVPADRRK